jgi:hypothetical protein
MSQNRRIGLLARCVHQQDVEAAESFDRICDELAAECWIAQAAGKCDALAPLAFDQVDDLTDVGLVSCRNRSRRRPSRA